MATHELERKSPLERPYCGEIVDEKKPRAPGELHLEGSVEGATHDWPTHPL
ncbi:MAG: hypothetical protein ABI884_06385 [Gemmatimonadota bacterium]